MSGVPYTFASATTSIPLSELDANFNTGLTIGTTTVGLGNTVTTLSNLTSISTTADITVHGLTVGEGGGSVSTNTAVGVNALSSNSSGTQSTGVGANALQYQTNNNNTAFGYNALLGVSGSSNGGSNTGIGSNALAGLTSGNYNTAIGQQSLVANTTASNNTAVGYQAGYTNSTGSDNTFIGYQAGYTSNVGGVSCNTCVGAQSGYSLTTGTSNTFIGTSKSNYAAGFYVTSGSNNTIIGGYDGNQGGLDIRTSSNKIVLSDGDGNPLASCGTVPNGASSYSTNTNGWTFGNGGTSATNDGFLVLNGTSASGYGAAIYGYSNGTVIFRTGRKGFIDNSTDNSYEVQTGGSGGVYLASGGTSWTAVSSDAREKKDFAPVEGLTQLLQVIPTKYRYITESETDPIHMGFTAQNLQPLIPDMVVTRNEKFTDGTPLLTITPDYMLPVLVQSIKDLNAIVVAQQATITTMQGQITALQAKVGV